jgi:hypothetical protein
MGKRTIAVLALTTPSLFLGLMVPAPSAHANPPDPNRCATQYDPSSGAYKSCIQVIVTHIQANLPECHQLQGMGLAPAAAQQCVDGLMAELPPGVTLPGLSPDGGAIAGGMQDAPPIPADAPQEAGGYNDKNPYGITGPYGHEDYPPSAGPPPPAAPPPPVLPIAPAPGPGNGGWPSGPNDTWLK